MKMQVNLMHGPIDVMGQIRKRIYTSTPNIPVLTPQTEEGIATFVCKAYNEVWEQMGGLAWRCMLIIFNKNGQAVINDQMQWEYCEHSVAFFNEGDLDATRIHPEDMDATAIRLYAVQAVPHTLQEIEVSVAPLSSRDCNFVMRDNKPYQTLQETLKYLPPA